MSPGGRCKSASRIVANNAVVFPPELRMKAAKSNGVGAGCCCRMPAAHFEAACHPVHFRRLLDHRVATESRRLKVRILTQATELDAEQ